MLKKSQEKKYLRQFRSGDTLIEVLFAVATMSLVIVLSLSLMNQGTSSSIRSLQITLARQQIDSQAEALRFLNSAYVAAYSTSTPVTAGTDSPARVYKSIVADVESQGKTSVSAFGGGGSTSCSAAPSGSFVINTRLAQYSPYTSGKLRSAVTYPQLVYNGDDTLSQSQGLWIEAVRSGASGGSRYTDFHIRTCWGSPGMSQPMNIGTIVRLYDPTN